MRKPACYPNHCHTCESAKCYEEVTCRHRGCTLELNIHNDESECPKCGGEIIRIDYEEEWSHEMEEGK